MSAPLLSLQAVAKRYGGLVAVDAVTLDVSAGGVTGIIGPNGAGKTTLFNLIAGSQSVTSGRVLFEGGDVTTLPAHRRADLGIARTFQITQPFAGLSVRENIAVGAYLRHADRDEALARAGEIARDVGLERASRHFGRQSHSLRAQAARGGARARHRAKTAAARRMFRRAEPE